MWWWCSQSHALHHLEKSDAPHSSVPRGHELKVWKLLEREQLWLRVPSSLLHNFQDWQSQENDLLWNHGWLRRVLTKRLRQKDVGKKGARKNQSENAREMKV